MPNSKQIIYLSQVQYAELIANQSITVNGVTVNYNDNDIYVTPQEKPITDIKIRNLSINQNGIVTIPLGGLGGSVGLVCANPYYGTQIYNGDTLGIYSPPEASYKSGASAYGAVTLNNQHMSIFYGLSKLAGVDLANETVTLGIYPDSSKAAIQNMLGITDLISTEESSTATAAHALNSTFMMNGKLHRATAAIAIGDAVEVGTNCEVVKADEVFVKNTDIAAQNTAGVVKINPDYGIGIINGYLMLNQASADNIKAGNNSTKAVSAYRQHEAVFYGLSKLAGVDLKNETVTLGTYPESSKTAIRSMLGATSSNVIAVQDEQPTDTDTKVWLPETEAQGIQVPTMEDMNTALAGKVSDVQIDRTSIVTNGIASIPLGGYGTYGVMKIHTNPGNNGLRMNNNELQIYPALDNDFKTKNSARPITPDKAHFAAFYGLATAAGDTTQSISTNAVGTYTDDAKAAIQTMLGVPGDVQINGVSIINNGVANIPFADSENAGVGKLNNSYGITRSSGGIFQIYAATDDNIKTGTSSYRPIIPIKQHQAVFYGLAKAAGDTTQSASSNEVGTYTTEAKAAIHTMLGIDPASIAAQVDIPLVETVSGTTPTITGQPNVRYVCGEVSTISITPPASGSVDVIFESGSTATTMTVPSTVKWPAWFDAEALEANTTYEVLITDGIYGSVMTWAT